MNHAWTPEFWMTIPFIGLLLSIAILPLVTPGFWHHLKNQAIVSIAFAIPIVFICLKYSPHALGKSLTDYVSFVVLLGSLFIVSGGIWLAGDFKSTPAANTVLLAAGAILSNFVGTTGASMILVRPLLRANAHRKHHVYLPIFFIFLVSNIGGALTPLGDPPLFLGYLNGVPFFWTLRLFPLWLTALGILLTIFYWVDSFFLKWDKTPHSAVEPSTGKSPHLKGRRNAFCFAAIIGAVFLPEPFREIIMIIAALVSLHITPKNYHHENGFNYTPIIEVAIIFFGIFVTMVPALALLEARGAELGVTSPWQFFWVTGGFSSFLDNAPTYMTFAALGEGLKLGGPYFHMPEKLLLAISAGAVFFGANTYIGNAPNFMVRSIAQHRGWKMPSFFGYMAWSTAILLPLFLAITLIFFC
ncbi:MAG: sodium:proton antiporter [Candidatus Omnitrophota bacterium]